jgi:ferric-dicitrate binding protein FerR (iron transport regulator)
VLGTIVFAARKLAQHPLLAPPRRGRVTTLAVAMLLLLAFAAIAIDSSNTVVIVNQALEKELGAPAPRPEIGLLLSTDGELRVNGEIASAGMPLRDGGRIDVVRGDAIVRFGDVPVAVLHEGTSVTFDGAGSEATLHHGRAQFEVAHHDDASNPFRVRAGSVDVDADGTVLIVERTRTDDRVLVVVRGRIGGVRVAADRVAADRVVRSGPPERAESAGLDKLKRRAGRLFERLAPKER